MRHVVLTSMFVSKNFRNSTIFKLRIRRDVSAWYRVLITLSFPFDINPTDIAGFKVGRMSKMLYIVAHQQLSSHVS